MTSRPRRTSAGYSGTPLPDKLGIKAAMRVVTVAAPKDFAATLGTLPDGASLSTRLTPNAAMVIAFVKSLVRLRAGFARWKRALASNGALWVCWPKRASGVVTDVSESDVRDIGLGCGLVDVKICAVDETWSGLRFVYRLKDRTR
jgi:hypothetical protein